MEHYVTLFNSLFLPQGICLYRSMQRHLRAHTLWILCVDDETHLALTRLELPNVRLLRLSELECEALLRVKATRSVGEYCWTLTPFAPKFVFDADESVRRVTYVDADLWFRKDPVDIYDEFEVSGKDVLITDHAYAPENDQSALSGQYCVQFIIFNREGGESVRHWWQERCLEWCYARHEDGKFGDQKYLEQWPSIFRSKVHVLLNQSLIMGPWNATRFPYSAAVVWHFHGARVNIRANRLRRLWAGSYPLPSPVVTSIYQPYFRDMGVTVSQLATIVPTLVSQPIPGVGVRVALFLRAVWRQLWKLRAGRVISP